MHAFRRHSLLPAVVAFAITLTACGSDGASDSAGDAAQPTEADTGGADGSSEPPHEQATGDDGAVGEQDTGTGEQDGEAGEAGTEGAAEDGEDGEDGEAGTEGAAEEGAAEEGAAGSDAVPTDCPDGVLKTGDRIAHGFEHVEIGPTDVLNVLTCEWRAAGDSIESIEVNFSGELIGTDLAELDNAEGVTVAGVKGHAMRSDDGQMNMFQFQVEDLFITGGSMEVDEVERGDVLELAKAAIQAVSS